MFHNLSYLARKTIGVLHCENIVIKVFLYVHYIQISYIYLEY